MKIITWSNFCPGGPSSQSPHYSEDAWVSSTASQNNCEELFQILYNVNAILIQLAAQLDCEMKLFFILESEKFAKDKQLKR